jgi:hypothetical protein
MNREQRRAQVDDTIGLKVDGVTYPLRMSDISATIEMELFRVTGLTITDIGTALTSGSPGVMHAAALVWLSRRTHGDTVAFGTVADAISYGSEIEIIDDAESPAPEVLAAD